MCSCYWGHASALSLTLWPPRRADVGITSEFFTLKQLQFHFYSSQHAGSRQAGHSSSSFALTAGLCSHPTPSLSSALQHEEQLFQQGFHYFIPNPVSVVVHTIVLFDRRLVIRDQGVDCSEDKFRNCKDKR